MRVAGSVIWSTDFVETEQEGGGGKGKPSQTSYSYSVSLAVLLSARRIGGVRRIWADGKLLRGAAGDFKTPTAFRLHLGSERSEEHTSELQSLMRKSYAVFCSKKNK